MKKIINNLNLLLFFIVFSLSCFVINAILDYIIYQKNYNSEYFIANPNYNKKKEEINQSKETLLPNIGSIVTNPGLTKILDKKNLISFGDVANSKILLCNETGEYVVYNSDSYGFRNTNDKIYDHNDFIIIGDSFGIGVCVKDKDYYNGVKGKFINLSVTGSGPLSQAILLNEYIKKYNTKEVYWFFFEGNDMLDLKQEINNQIFKKFTKKEIVKWPKFNYFENKFFVDKLLLNYLTNLSKSKKYQNFSFEEIQYGKKFSFLRLIKFTATRNLLTNLRNNNHYDQSRLLDEYFSIISKINNKLIKNNIKLNIVFLPSYEIAKNKKISKNVKDIKNIYKLNFNNIKIHNFDTFIINKFNLDDIFITPKTHYTIKTYKELFNYINIISNH